MYLVRRQGTNMLRSLAGAAVILAAVAALPSCAPQATQPVTPVTEWKPYRSEGGRFSMEAPAEWDITERGGAGGYETTLKANSSNWIMISQQLLPPGLESKILHSDTRDTAIIEAVQSHYDKLKQTHTDFRGDAPQVTTVASGMAGYGTFTCKKKNAFGGAVEFHGFTGLLIGLNYLYVFDAFADAKSSEAVGAAFEHIVTSFKYED
jgi:hypothetical protein